MRKILAVSVVMIGIIAMLFYTSSKYYHYPVKKNISQRVELIQKENKSSNSTSSKSAHGKVSEQRPMQKVEGKPMDAEVAAKYSELFEEFQKAMATSDPKVRFTSLYKLAKKAPAKELLGMIIPMIMGSGEPQDVWDKLKDLYYSVDLAALPAVANAMKAMSIPAYFTLSVEATASRTTDPARQVFAVGELREMAVKGEQPTPPIQSSLAYTALNNPSPEVRSATLSALSEFGDNTVSSRLTEYIGTETDPTLRASAESALSAVSSREPEYRGR